MAREHARSYHHVQGDALKNRRLTKGYGKIILLSSPKPPALPLLNTAHSFFGIAALGR